MSDQLQPETEHVDAATTPVPDSTTRPRPAWLIPLVTGSAGFMLGGLVFAGVPALVGAIGSASSGVLFQQVLDDCNVSGSGAVISDGGHTLSVDGAGEDAGSGEIEIDELECIIDGTGAPTSVKTLMYETRALDGRQEREWADMRASWSYHPDNGLDIIFERP